MIIQLINLHNRTWQLLNHLYFLFKDRNAAGNNHLIDKAIILNLIISMAYIFQLINKLLITDL